MIALSLSILSVIFTGAAWCYAFKAESQYRDALICKCGQARRDGYASGYEDGRYDVKGGSK